VAVGASPRARPNPRPTAGRRDAVATIPAPQIAGGFAGDYTAPVMTEPWRPRSVRIHPDARTSYEALHEGVPVWLRRSLIHWVDARLPNEQRPQAAVLMKLERMLRVSFDWESVHSAMRTFSAMLWNDAEFLLDVVDYFLQSTSYSSERETLEDILSQGGSAWRVAERNDGFRLESRVLPQMQALAEAALGGSGNDAEYLRQAWQCAFGRSPQPSEAFDHSVKAIEATLTPIVTPKDPTPTLGKMIAALRANPAKWKLRLSGKKPDTSVTALAEYLDVVWASHLRHGLAGKGAKLHHSPEEARDAVIVAVHVVQLIHSGALSPV